MEKKDEFEGIPRSNPHFILCDSDKAEDWGWTKEYVEEVYDLLTEYPDSEELEDAGLQNNIGCMFENGLFGPKNTHEAVRWYEKSAAQGNDLAKSNLADILRKGTGGYPVDLKRAFELYKSCGLPYAHYRVGEFYEKGWGIDANISEAKRYYRLAYQEGHGLAKKKLAEFNFMEDVNEAPDALECKECISDSEQPSFNIDIPYKESVFHIFGVSGLDIDQLWKQAPKYCSDDGFSGQIAVQESDGNDDTRQEYLTFLWGASTQGVSVTYCPGEKAHFHIDLPWLGSVGDVKLAFAYMKTLRDLFPDCEIYYNVRFEDGQFGLQEENYEAMIAMRFRNMMHLVESAKDGQSAGAPGLFHPFIAPSMEDNTEASMDDVVMTAMDKFVELQWRYADYENASLANAISPSGEKYTLRILTNSANTFVSVCQHLAILNKNESVKDVEAGYFISVMNDNPYFKLVDELQFVLDKMPDDEWEKMYDSLEGQELKK